METDNRKNERSQDEDKPAAPRAGAAAAEEGYREEPPQEMDCDQDDLPDLLDESDTEDAGSQRTARTRGRDEPEEHRGDKRQKTR